MADNEKTPASNSKEEKKPVAAVAPKKEKVPFKARFQKFIRDYKSEIKKIVWPSFKQTTSNTKIVIIAILMVTVAVGILDFAFSKGIFALGLLGK